MGREYLHIGHRSKRWTDILSSIKVSMTVKLTLTLKSRWIHQYFNRFFNGNGATLLKRLNPHYSDNSQKNDEKKL